MTTLRPPVADRLLAAGSFALSVVAAFTLEAVTVEDERSVDLSAIALLAAMSAPQPAAGVTLIDLTLP